MSLEQADMIHCEIMWLTQEHRRLFEESPIIWMTQEVYDLLFDSLYYGEHFAVSVSDKCLRYFGCKVKIIDEPGLQYIVGHGWEEKEETS